MQTPKPVLRRCPKLSRNPQLVLGQQVNLNRPNASTTGDKAGQFGSLNGTAWPALAEMDCPLADIHGGSFTVGCFRHTTDASKSAVMIVNYE